MNTSPLISAEELVELRTDDEADAAAGLVVLDVTWNLTGPPGRSAYDEGHIPGAHFLDLDADLAGPPGDGGRHPLPDAAVVQAALRRAGVGTDSAVVVYDAATSLAAARAWWVLRYFGVGDVRVLDGGFAAWQAAGGAVSTTEPPQTAGSFVASPGHLPVLDADGAARVAESGVLLDARAPERFAGENEPMDAVAGHIPGAVNAPVTATLRPDGRFRPAAELRRHFGALGADGSAPIGTYCGSGVTAAHEALSLELAGLDSAVYVGSWSHWITDPDRPTATGH